MTFSLGLLIALVIPLILIEGFFSGSEIALLSADKLALKRQIKQGSEGAKRALELASNPDRVLSTTLLMTNLCVIALSALIAVYFLGRGSKHADLMAVLVTSPLVVLLGELIPKTIYRRYANTLAPWVAVPVSWAFWVFYPATKVLSAYTSYLAKLAGPIEELMTGKRKSTREEIRSLLTYSRRESDLKTSEKRMIKRIFEFKDSEAKHALIPLVKVEAIADGATVREALERFETHRHSRMPVYSGRIDNIIGVIETSDLFSAVDLNHPIRNYITSAHYVAETQSLEDLMAEMQREDAEMVVVVDEHGGAIGILTFEDIVEEIVGEIDDEYDIEIRPYKEISEGKWLVQAKMEIQAINESLKLELPEGEYETVAGFLLQQFGRIPDPRDELYFDTKAGSYKFTIREANQRQIESVLVERTPSRKPPPEH